MRKLFQNLKCLLQKIFFSSKMLQNKIVTIPALTSFRFLPALFIFLLHCRIFFGWGEKTVDNFPVFMTAFFVLSGFILSHAHRFDDFGKRKIIFDFYLKRFARIFPAYIVAVLVYSCFVHDIKSATGVVIFGDSSFLKTLRSLIDSLFLVQGFFVTTHHGFTFTSWSLTCEMFFYFLFPLLTIICNRSPKIIFFALAIAAIASFNVILVPRGEYIYPNPIWRLSDFMIGMGFYYLCQTKKFGNVAHLFVIASLPLVILLGDVKYQYMQGQVIIGLIFALWLACIYTTKLQIFTNSIAVYLGKISYSFYLWQFLTMAGGKILLEEFPDINLNMLVGLMLLLNIGIASLSYYFIEVKSKRFILA